MADLRVAVSPHSMVRHLTRPDDRKPGERGRTLCGVLMRGEDIRNGRAGWYVRPYEVGTVDCQKCRKKNQS